MTKTQRAARWRRPAFAAALLCLLVVGAQPAAAHAAPPPTDQYTRLLHDHNDDCGGDGTDLHCGGTHDLIALDLREAWDPMHGDVLVFRFILDEGAGGVLRDMLAFKIGDEVHTYVLREEAGVLSGSFDAVGAKRPLGDGTRFEVEATVARASLGAGVGDVLSDFRVEATRDGGAGDYMPGGYRGPAGVEDPPQGERQTNFRLASLTIKGPVQYGSMSLQPAEATVQVGVETLVTVVVRNGLDDLPETFRFSVEGGPGVLARFHDPDGADGSGYSDTYTLELAADRSGALHLAVEGTEADATGTLVVTMQSDRGGRVQETFTYGVGTEPPGGTGSPTPGSDTPGLLAPLVGLMLLSLARVARRR